VKLLAADCVTIPVAYRHSGRLRRSFKAAERIEKPGKHRASPCEVSKPRRITASTALRRLLTARFMSRYGHLSPMGSIRAAMVSAALIRAHPFWRAGIEHAAGPA
jgi:hypothetical protein